MRQLSVLIPARNELFLNRTIEEVLAKRRADTEVIAVLDGAWPDVPLVQHPDVTVVHRPVSIGQRAATNLAATLSDAQYVCKLDAHCSLDDGFDQKLIDADLEIGRPDLTQIPGQYNLHAFDWVCGCGKRIYQGPTPAACACGLNTWERDIVWSIDGANGKAGRKVYTTSWCFDADLHFQYFGEFNDRPDSRGDLVPTMSALGACFFMRRSRFFELGGLDEGHGSWGQFGTEIACKSWLSGGLHYVNKRTWFAHLFRTQGGDFGFPYHQDAKQVEHARAYSQDLWRGNKWPGQIHPLSWLVDKCWPVKGWTEEQRAALPSSLEGSVFRIPNDCTGGAMPPASPTGLSISAGQGVSSDARLLSGVDSAPIIGAAKILNVQDEPQMRGIAAGRSVADDVIKHGDVAASTHRKSVHEPREHQPVGQHNNAVVTEVAVPETVVAPGPKPTTGSSVHGDFREEASKDSTVDVFNREKLSVSHLSAWLESSLRSQRIGDSPIVSHKTPTKGAIWYSDCLPSEDILSASRQSVEQSGLPIVAATLAKIDWPAARCLVLPYQRGTLSMFLQILAALEASTSDVIFFCEHDCVYHPTHFQFTPPRSDTYFFNEHTYKVDAETGRAVFYHCKQTSGLCASRALLLTHYRERVRRVEAEGFSRRMGFEPGTHRRKERVDDVKAEAWMSAFPNIDIRHRHNLTPSRWSPTQFRDPRHCRGWNEVTDIPGWGNAKQLIERLCDREGVSV